MALKLHDNQPITMPGTVKAVVAKRWGNIQANTSAKVRNADKIREAGQVMNRMYKKDELN